MSGDAQRQGDRWSPGDTAVLRYLTRTGAPGMSWPTRVVEDREDLLALYIPRGATYMAWDTSSGRRQLAESRWRRDVLRLMFPGEPYSIWLFWTDDPGHSFHTYYVNMEEPFRRTPIGVDTNDHTLDVVVRPDRTWSWKDSEQFDDRVRAGVYSEEFARECRSKAESVIEKLECWSSPFCDGWERWEPHPNWDIPRLPADWADVPPRVWDRSTWAYLDARR